MDRISKSFIPLLKKNYFWVVFNLIHFNRLQFAFSFLSWVFLLAIYCPATKCWFIHSCQMYSQRFWLVLKKSVHSFNLVDIERVSTKKVSRWEAGSMFLSDRIFIWSTSFNFNSYNFKKLTHLNHINLMKGFFPFFFKSILPVLLKSFWLKFYVSLWKKLKASFFYLIFFIISFLKWK